MSGNFLHGTEVITIDKGPRTIRAIKSSVIGIVGTAPDADPAKFPLNTPVMVAGRRADAAGLGEIGTLPVAVDGVFDHIGAIMMIVRVAEAATEAETLSNIIGGTDNVTGAPLGLQSLLSAKSTYGVAPRILIAPSFTQNLSVVNEFIPIAERLHGVIVADGPNSTDADALAYRAQIGSKRVYLVDPAVKAWSTTANAETVQPASARVAGLMARMDHEKGYWNSPSNELINVTGTARPIDFELGVRTSRANLLNEQEIATIIREEGYRLWGNRTCTSDPKWAFLKRVRIADMVDESIQQRHLWAVDRNIDLTYVEDVVEGVNDFGRSLVKRGALVDFKCWAEPDLNTIDDLEDGRATFDYDWVETPTAERITFRSQINRGYLTQVLPAA